MRGPAPNLERGKAAPSADSAPAPVDTKAAEEAAKKAEEEAIAAGYVAQVHSPFRSRVSANVLGIPAANRRAPPEPPVCWPSSTRCSKRRRLRSNNNSPKTIRPRLRAGATRMRPIITPLSGSTTTRKRLDGRLPTKRRWSTCVSWSFRQNLVHKLTYFRAHLSSSTLPVPRSPTRAFSTSPEKSPARTTCPSCTCSSSQTRSSGCVWFLQRW